MISTASPSMTGGAFRFSLAKTSQSGNTTNLMVAI
jgi:hypothetical protein